MATYSSLEARAIDFGSQQSYLESIKSDYSASTIQEIYKSEAKEQLLNDLQVALNRQPTVAGDLSDIDAVVDEQEPRLQRALAVKQLSLIFEERNRGEGSQSFDFWQHYTALYETMRRGFPGLIRRQGSVRVRSVANHR